MDSPNIVFRGFENSGEQSSAKILLGSLLFLVPHWVKLISVKRMTTTSIDDPACAIETCEKNRWCAMSLYEGFFSSPEDEQSIYMIHELLHLQHCVVVDWVMNRLIKPLSDRNMELHGYCLDEFTERFERFTEDMAHIIHALLQDVNAAHIVDQRFSLEELMRKYEPEAKQKT